MARHNIFLLGLFAILGLDSGYMGIELWMVSDLFPLDEWISKCEWFIEFCWWERTEESWILTTWVLTFIQSVCWVRLSLNIFYISINKDLFWALTASSSACWKPTHLIPSTIRRSPVLEPKRVIWRQFSELKIDSWFLQSCGKKYKISAWVICSK